MTTSTIYRGFWRGFWLVLVLPALGCGGKPLPPFNKDVKGTLKVNGLPLANVRVMFMPQKGPHDDSLVGPNANAITDQNGQFQLTSDNWQPGAVLGKHRVVLSQGRPVSADGERGAIHAVQIPSVYGSLTDSPLLVEVRADQNVYDLEIASE